MVIVDMAAEGVEFVFFLLIGLVFRILGVFLVAHVVRVAPFQSQTLQLCMRDAGETLIEFENRFLPAFVQLLGVVVRPMGVGFLVDVEPKVP